MRLTKPRKLIPICRCPIPGICQEDWETMVRYGPKEIAHSMYPVQIMNEWARRNAIAQLEFEAVEESRVVA